MPSITRHASAEWDGSGKDGTGSRTPRGTLKDTPYGFNTRFGDAKGMNTEELIAGACGLHQYGNRHSAQRRRNAPESLHTDATLTMEPVPDCR